MCRQAKDTINYQGVLYIIKFTHPKEKTSCPPSPLYPLKEQLGVLLSPIQMNSGNWRGFTCGWKIDENQLYLIRFSSNSFRIYTFDQFLGKTPPDDENVRSEKKLYPPDEVHYKADWFSGVIVAYVSRTQDKNEHNGWDLEFEKGRLIRATSRFVETPKGLKDYIEEE